MPAERRPLPPPEWFEELRLLHLHYGQEYDAITTLPVSEDEKRWMSTRLWVETEEVRKRLMKDSPPTLQCTGVKPDGHRCSRPAQLDYIGQQCASHAPHISAYPDLAETRRLWPLHERNQEPGPHDR